MAFIHIAYRSHDRELALKLQDELEKKKHVVTIDVKFLMAGHYWRRRIDEAFEAAEFLVVLLTKNGGRLSDWCHQLPLDRCRYWRCKIRKKVVLPVLLNDIPFPELIDDIYCIRPSQDSLQEAASRP